MLILGGGSCDLVCVLSFSHIQSNVVAYCHGSIPAKLYCIKVSYIPCCCSHAHSMHTCRAIQFAEMIKECDDIVFPKVTRHM